MADMSVRHRLNTHGFLLSNVHFPADIEQNLYRLPDKRRVPNTFFGIWDLQIGGDIRD